MPDRVDVLDADPRRGSPVLILAAFLLLAVVTGGAVLYDRPPAPLRLRVEQLDGSALRDESFVRLHVQLEAEGASGLGEVRLRLAGADSLGQHPPRFDDRGRATVQVDITPRCAQVADGLLPTGSLAVQVQDSAGRPRLVELPVPTGGQLERLVRYRCR